MFVTFITATPEMIFFVTEWVRNSHRRQGCAPLGALLEKLFLKFGAVNAVQQTTGGENSFEIKGGNVLPV